MPDRPLIAITLGDPSGIGPERFYLSSFGLDPLDQGREFVSVSSCHTGHIPFSCEPLGNCTPCRVSCANDNDSFLLHSR